MLPSTMVAVPSCGSNSVRVGILGMKMRRCVIGKVHLDHDPLESTQLRHRSAHAAIRGRSLPLVWLSIEDRGNGGTDRFHQAR